MLVLALEFSRAERHATTPPLLLVFGHAQGERPQSSSHVVGGGIAGIRPDMVAPSKRKSENRHHPAGAEC